MGGAWTKQAAEASVEFVAPADSGPSAHLALACFHFLTAAATKPVLQPNSTKWRP